MSKKQNFLILVKRTRQIHCKTYAIMTKSADAINVKWLIKVDLSDFYCPKLKLSCVSKINSQPRLKPNQVPTEIWVIEMAKNESE